MKLAHISDLHLLPDASNSAQQKPSSTDVASAIANDLAAIAKGLDLVVVSGDIAEHADAESFANFEQLFAGIVLPVVIVPGNHDGPAGILDYVASSLLFADWHLTNRLIEIGGIRFLGLNTSVEALTQGALDDEALSLVERADTQHDHQASWCLSCIILRWCLVYSSSTGFAKLKEAMSCLT